MKLLLTSSGLKNEYIVEALQKLVEKSLAETSIVFVPTAANPGTDDKSWVIENLKDFQRCGFKSIDIIDVALPDEVWKPHFLAADIICFGGGNEKYLARIIEENKIKEFLVPLLNTKVYMGISAGSMVAGHFLTEDLNSELFPEEDYGSEHGLPIELYDFAFIPHLNSGWFKHLRREFINNIEKERFSTSVYVADDETAIKIDGSVIEVVGKGDYLIINK